MQRPAEWRRSAQPLGLEAGRPHAAPGQPRSADPTAPPPPWTSARLVLAGHKQVLQPTAHPQSHHSGPLTGERAASRSHSVPHRLPPPAPQPSTSPGSSACSAAGQPQRCCPAAAARRPARALMTPPAADVPPRSLPALTAAMEMERAWSQRTHEHVRQACENGAAMIDTLARQSGKSWGAWERSGDRAPPAPHFSQLSKACFPAPATLPDPAAQVYSVAHGASPPARGGRGWTAALRCLPTARQPAQLAQPPPPPFLLNPLLQPFPPTPALCRSLVRLRLLASAAAGRLGCVRAQGGAAT